MALSFFIIVKMSIMHLNALLKEEQFTFIGKGDVCFDLPEWLLMSLLAILLLGKW